MDKECVSFNLARLKKGGQVFEIVVNPDEAIDYINKKIEDTYLLPKGSEHIQVNDANKCVAYTVKNNLFSTGFILKPLYRPTDKSYRHVNLFKEYTNGQHHRHNTICIRKHTDRKIRNRKNSRPYNGSKR